MKRSLRICLVLIATVLSVVVAQVPAGATTIPPPGGGTVAYPASVTKSGSTITVKFKLTSDSGWDWMDVTGAITRTGGGHSQVDLYDTQQCGRSTTALIYSCTLTMTINDVSGTENYWLWIVPSVDGTKAGRQSKVITCRDTISCSSTNVQY